MTNPTLERAARALIRAKYGDADDSYWEMLDGDAKNLARTMARAVLMAVLPELKRVTPEELGPVGREWMEDFVSSDGEYVRYDDLTAILAEGE